MGAGLPAGPSYPSLIQGIGVWTRPLAFLERCRARYGKRFTLRLPFAPPFVIITEPEQVKEIFTAPPDVLHPGEGARVLEPLVGRNSVILLDGAAHMEQRKLMLPAFHGERMERLTELVAEVTEREVAGWERERDRAAPAAAGADAGDHPPRRLRARPGPAARRAARAPRRSCSPTATAR